ncbi:unnamed protein product [Hapterophycus canaliculatus]
MHDVPFVSRPCKLDHSSCGLIRKQDHLNCNRDAAASRFTSGGGTSGSLGAIGRIESFNATSPAHGIENRVQHAYKYVRRLMFRSDVCEAKRKPKACYIVESVWWRLCGRSGDTTKCCS